MTVATLRWVWVDGGSFLSEEDGDMTIKTGRHAYLFCMMGRGIPLWNYYWNYRTKRNSRLGLWFKLLGEYDSWWYCNSYDDSMKISHRSIEVLANIIIGDRKWTPYRGLSSLCDFFRYFGEDDHYMESEDDFIMHECEVDYNLRRLQYTRKKLIKFNGKEELKEIIANAFNFFDEDRCYPVEAAKFFNRTLSRDGHQLIMKHKAVRKVEGQDYELLPYFEIEPVRDGIITPGKLIALNHSELNEHIEKATNKIKSGDLSGAITNCYTLTEGLLKKILRDAGVDFKKTEGNIQKLYTLARGPLNLNPADRSISAPLKSVLASMQKLISGVYEISNKAGDRHSRPEPDPQRCNPAAHEAKLVVNMTFAFCEFLIESRDYEETKRVGAENSIPSKLETVELDWWE